MASRSGAHHYSVSAVVSAFASQGVHLVRVPLGRVHIPKSSGLTASQRRKLIRHLTRTYRNLVKLEAGRPPDAVLAVVETGAAPPSVPFRTEVAGDKRFITRALRNVVIWFDRSQRTAVLRALTRLH